MAKTMLLGKTKKKSSASFTVREDGHVVSSDRTISPSFLTDFEENDFFPGRAEKLSYHFLSM